MLFGVNLHMSVQYLCWLGCLLIAPFVKMCLRRTNNEDVCNSVKTRRRTQEDQDFRSELGTYNV